MNCPKCGREISGLPCPYCDVIITDQKHCPRCGSTHVHARSETTEQVQGYGCLKGCLGYLCLGPIGWLCGLLGMGKGRRVTRTFLVCEDCHHRFFG